MNTESGAHGVSHFQFSASPATVNCAAFSTGIIGTGLAFSLYAILKGGRHGHLNPYIAFTPVNVHWLEYPATAYAPPVMNLFIDDQVPFGVSPLLSCPKDTEHLERTFDTLRYRHMSGELGVPSVVNQDTTLVLPLRVLGNASSSFGFLSAANSLPGPSTQGGCQEVNSGCTGSVGGEKNANGKSPYPTSSYLMAMSSTRLPFVSGDGHYIKGEAISDWSCISVASLIAAITVVALLAKGGQSHCRSSSEPSTTVENFWDVQVAGSGGDDKDSVFDEGCAPVRSSQLVLGDSINVKQRPERLFEADPLAGSYTPGVVFDAFDNDSHVRSEVGFQEASAPVDFAARFDALQDALFSEARSSDATSTVGSASDEIPHFETQKIQPSASGSTSSSIVDGNTENCTQIIDLTHVDEEIQAQLLSSTTSASPQDALFSDARSSDVTLAVGIANSEIPHVEAQNIKPSAGGCTQIIDLTQVDEEIQAHPSCSTSAASASPLGQTVETFLAPIFDEEKAEVEDDVGGPWTFINRRGKRGRNGKAKADVVPKETVQNNGTVGIEGQSVEPVSRPPTILREDEPLRKRGRRGHGRGRGSRRSREAASDTTVIN